MLIIWSYFITKITAFETLLKESSNFAPLINDVCKKATKNKIKAIPNITLSFRLNITLPHTYINLHEYIFETRPVHIPLTYSVPVYFSQNDPWARKSLQTRQIIERGKQIWNLLEFPSTLLYTSSKLLTLIRSSLGKTFKSAIGAILVQKF